MIGLVIFLNILLCFLFEIMHFYNITTRLSLAMCCPQVCDFFCSSLTLLLPNIWKMTLSIPFLTSPSAPIITGTVFVFVVVMVLFVYQSLFLVIF